MPQLDQEKLVSVWCDAFQTVDVVEGVVSFSASALRLCDGRYQSGICHRYERKVVLYREKGWALRSDQVRILGLGIFK